MLTRSFDIEHINAVVNHPAVRPFVGGEGHLDLSPVVEQHLNVFLMGEHGGFLLAWSAPNVHEIHTFILPQGRGAWASSAAQELITFARQSGDHLIWTKVPKDQKNVEVFTRRAGLKDTGLTVELFDRLYSVYSLEFETCQ